MKWTNTNKLSRQVLFKQNYSKQRIEYLMRSFLEVAPIIIQNRAIFVLNLYRFLYKDSILDYVVALRQLSFFLACDISKSIFNRFKVPS